MRVINSHCGAPMKHLLSIKHGIRRASAQIGHTAMKVGRITSSKASALIAQARGDVSTPGEYNPPAPSYIPRRVAFREQIAAVQTIPKAAVVRNTPSTNLSAPRAYRQRPSARNQSQANAIPVKTDPPASDLDDFLDEFIPKDATGVPKRSPKAEVDQAFGDMLKELDNEEAETARQQSLQEVDSLLDQLDQEIAIKSPRPAAPGIAAAKAAKAAKARAAQAQLDASTTELTALLDGLKQNVVESRTSHVASASEMQPAGKVAVSGQMVVSEAVTECLEDLPSPLEMSDLPLARMTKEMDTEMEKKMALPAELVDKLYG